LVEFSAAWRKLFIMAGFRVYLPEGAPASGPLELPPSEAHHLSRVLRARVGDAVTLLDGKGNAWEAVISDVAPRKVQVDVAEQLAPAPPPAPVTLSLALVKGKAFDEVLRHATEIGVRTIQPVLTQRCEVKIVADRAENKLEHWQAVAVEACKQSGNRWLPEIVEPVPLKAAATASGQGVIRLVASLEDASVPLGQVLQRMDAATALEVMIGPEGDFTPEEYALLAESGYRPVRLGTHVLRAETAALYALSVIDQGCLQ